MAYKIDATESGLLLLPMVATTPIPQPVLRSSTSQASKRRPVLGGLINEYEAA
jgi:hypothetical protein